jgi:F-type H+-transporting ATPase subunit b
MPPTIPDGRVFGLDSQTFISVVVHLVNLVILAFVMSKLLYKPVREFLYNRSHRIDDQLRHARDEKAAAEKLRIEYEGKLGEISAERGRVLEEARREAEEQRDRVIADAQAEAGAMRAATEEEIAKMKADARDEMRKTIIDTSAAMAEKIVARALDESAFDELFSQTVSDLEDSTWWE